MSVTSDGLVRRRNRRTGALIEIRDRWNVPEDQSRSDLRWQLVCTTHGEESQGISNRSVANVSASKPWEWCGTCAATLAGGSTVPEPKTPSGRAQSAIKLDRVVINNFRSLYKPYRPDETGGEFRFELAGGMTTVVGPNNVGKSNVFKALAIALGENPVFDSRKDIPEPAPYAKPKVRLEFSFRDVRSGTPEATLRRYLKEYEEAVNPTGRRTFADEDRMILDVVMDANAERPIRQRFVAKGAGSRTLPDEHDLTQKTLAQFRKCFRFVYVQSGQSLESLLEGKFRDILQSVLKDHLGSAYQAAHDARASFVAGVREGLLAPLERRISDEMQMIFPEVHRIELDPGISSLDEALTRMTVEVTDSAPTSLVEKGTGVRSGLLVSILGHLADQSRRSMLFAVEEPESFLHPAAQEALRDGLESIAARPNVSLLVATHSPFIVSRTTESRVIALAKTGSGRTYVRATAKGDEPHAEVVSALFRDRSHARILDRARTVRSDAQAVLVVEGYTDLRYLQTAARLLGDEDFLRDVQVVYGDPLGDRATSGASSAVVQAIVLSAIATVPVLALFDGDEVGNTAVVSLRWANQKHEYWKVGRNLLQYTEFIPNGNNNKDFGWEAEDLWPDQLIADFVRTHGGDVVRKGLRERPRNVGGWSHDIRHDAKTELADYIDAHATAGDADRWRALLERVRAGAQLTRDAVRGTE